MSRCTCCDWSPNVPSLSFISPKPDRLVRHGVEEICDICLSTIYTNLSAITKEKKYETAEDSA